NLVIQSFEVLVTVPEDDKNTRYLYGVIKNKKDKYFSDARDEKNRKAKREEMRSLPKTVTQNTDEAYVPVSQLFADITGNKGRDSPVPSITQILAKPNLETVTVQPLPL
ncbi:MAG: hypothetical protein HY965_06840, partial [Ignavibacteriales bacterium]|nr:hypothetical protein [Ignavibacteriales bacterium]